MGSSSFNQHSVLLILGLYNGLGAFQNKKGGEKVLERGIEVSRVLLLLCYDLKFHPSLLLVVGHPYLFGPRKKVAGSFDPVFGGGLPSSLVGTFPHRERAG